MAIEIVDLPITVKIVIFHRFLYVYQRVQTIYNWGHNLFKTSLTQKTTTTGLLSSDFLILRRRTPAVSWGTVSKIAQVVHITLANSGLWYVITIDND